jgi:outer membrane protein assembly factor BamB
MNPYAHHDSYPAVSGGIAYFTALDGDLSAVDIKKGKILWSVPAKKREEVASGVNFWDGKLYYVDGWGDLCCVDAETRARRFRTRLHDRVFAPMLIDGGRVYLGGRSAKMYCVDGNDGSIIWASHLETAFTWFSGGSVISGDTLYACTSDAHSLAAFDRHTGAFLQRYPIEAHGYTRPLLWNGHIIVAAANVYNFEKSYIRAFDTESHAAVWQSVVGDSVLSSPALYRDVLYFGSDSGALYRIALR